MNSGAAAPLPQPSRVANINDANGDQRTAASARRRVRLRILTQVLIAGDTSVQLAPAPPPPNGHRNRDLHHEFARPPTLRPPMTSVSTRYRRPKFPTPRAWPSTDAPASLPSPHAAARPVRTLSALHAIPIHSTRSRSSHSPFSSPNLPRRPSPSDLRPSPTRSPPTCRTCPLLPSSFIRPQLPALCCCQCAAFVRSLSDRLRSACLSTERSRTAHACPPLCCFHHQYTATASYQQFCTHREFVFPRLRVPFPARAITSLRSTVSRCLTRPSAPSHMASGTMHIIRAG